MVRRPALFGGLIALALVAPADAEVTHFNVLERTMPALQGRSFGGAGQVEKITASATIALDPANPRNAVLVDLDRAPRSGEGKVEATSEVIILRPAYPNGILLFELPNRGRRLISAWFDNSSIQGSVRLDQADDAGRGFLLSQGYTLVWAGWQADAPTGPGMLGIQVNHDLTQEELAQLVGASRETVNKALADFTARGWIQLSAKSVLITDMDRLRKRAR